MLSKYPEHAETACAKPNVRSLQVAHSPHNQLLCTDLCLMYRRPYHRHHMKISVATSNTHPSLRPNATTPHDTTVAFAHATNRAAAPLATASLDPSICGTRRSADRLSAPHCTALYRVTIIRYCHILLVNLTSLANCMSRRSTRSSPPPHIDRSLTARHNTICSR